MIAVDWCRLHIDLDSVVGRASTVAVADDVDRCFVELVPVDDCSHRSKRETTD